MNEPNKKIIDHLTPEQTQLMEQVAVEYEDNALGGRDDFDRQAIDEGIAFIYKLADLKVPPIILCDSPLAMAKQAGLKKGDTIDNLGCGYDSGWTAFYDFFERIGIEYDPAWGFTTWKNFILKSGVFATILFDEAAYVCRRPCLCKRNANFDLDCSDGPAIAWRDGYHENAMSGVFMEDWMVETRAEDIDPKRVLATENVEQRRELIRKIGVERFIQAAGSKSLDGPVKMVFNGLETEYELLAIDLSEEMRGRKFLKMLNPSIGVYVVEGVGQDCKTVKDAIHFRKPKKLQDIPVDDVNGTKYYQQGDVVLFEKDAKSVRFWPSVLT